MEDTFKKLSGKYRDILRSLNISEEDIKNNIKNPNELFKKFENEALSLTVLRITTSIASKLPKGLLFVISEKGEEMGISVIEKDEYISEM